MDSNNSLKAVTVSGVDWTVRGTVVGNSGQPIAGVMVEAWDKDLETTTTWAGVTPMRKDNLSQIRQTSIPRHGFEKGRPVFPDPQSWIRHAHTKDA